MSFIGLFHSALPEQPLLHIECLFSNKKRNLKAGMELTVPFWISWPQFVFLFFTLTESLKNLVRGIGLALDFPPLICGWK